MKKFLALSVALVLAFSLVACGGGGASSAVGSTTDTNADSKSTGDAKTDGGKDYSKTKLVLMVNTLGDLSFMDAAKDGLDRLEEVGFDTTCVECGTDSSKYDAYVLDICDSGADYLICSATYKDYVEAAAPDYPDMRFILFDSARVIDDPLDNIYYLSYAQNEGAYLTGMVAASLSESGVIGTIGGVQNPTICDFMVGYMEGAKAYNPEIKVVSAFMGNWTDVAMMRELYTAQYNTYKADVCFPLSGNAGVGVFEAANEFGTYCIGVDSDQYLIYSKQGNEYADVIVTSMLKEISNSIYNTVLRIVDEGYDPFGTAEVLGLSMDAVGYAVNENFEKHVDAEMVKELEAAKAKIVSGEIKVPSYYDFKNEEDFTEFANSFAP